MSTKTKTSGLFRSWGAIVVLAVAYGFGGFQSSLASCGDYLMPLHSEVSRQNFHGNSLGAATTEGWHDQLRTLIKLGGSQSGGHFRWHFGANEKPLCDGPNCSGVPTGAMDGAVSLAPERPTNYVTKLDVETSLPQMVFGRGWTAVTSDDGCYFLSDGLFRPPRID